MRRAIAFSAVLAFLLPSPAPSSAADPPLQGVRRVVFLGDSITYSGQYIEYVEACLRVKEPTLRCEFLDIGLPSETVSGLSEPGHAGGSFPRPDLHERLDRVLSKTKPDLVVACYGMNDGIYYPFGEDRLEKYQEGMRLLRDKAKAAGARIVHLTPPVFDPVPIKSKTLPAGLAEYRQPFEGYDEVLGRYSEWLLAQRDQGWDVVDVHGPMKTFLDEERARDPGFKLAGDGVHIDANGHWIIARAVLAHWGIPASELNTAVGAGSFLAAYPQGVNVLELVHQKQTILKDAWLTETGHKRPGMKKGLPRVEAERQAGEIEAEIRKRLAAGP